ncbi:MAG: hypothetical protein IJU71_10285 [Selenomonadaceae bacterium]|nr:hypothetical protein [Selenomonadaceae bacterium]
MNYIVSTVEEFFGKLDKMQRDLNAFSQSLDSRSDKIPDLLKNFERKVFEPAQSLRGGSKDAVAAAAQKSLDNLRAVVSTWQDKVEADRKGKEFIRKNEKYLVVMIFGAVKAGKSSLGNFFAGKKLVNAPFDNRYKHIPKPIFETEEKGRDTGDISKDQSGDTWFTEGVIDTTGAIQYFTLSGLRWIDSPGTGAVGKAGDTLDMTKLVEEYLAFTDMCIFLMNSSEPGLQDDMKYMQKLNREGQEALIVITKSDQAEEDVDDDGELISVLVPKTPANRKLQEDDICKRVKQKYPEIDEQKFRALSISTALAGEAVEQADEQKFRASNLDKLMKILGDKVSDNAIERKQANPRRQLNSFVDSVIDDLKKFEADIKTMDEAIGNYKAGMARMSDLIVLNVKREMRGELNRRATEWNRQVKRGSSVSNDAINAAVGEILRSTLNAEINAQMRRVIDDYRSREMPTVRANLSTAALEKKTVQIEHTYTESYTVEREADGFFEKAKSFLFDTKYYTTKHRTHTEYQTVDAGTTFNEFIDSLMPQAEEYARSQANASLAHLRDTYFAEREQFVKNMRGEIETLRAELNGLKF